MDDRFIQFRAAEYHLALPVVGVQSILSLTGGPPTALLSGSEMNSASLEPRQPVSLSRLLGARSIPTDEPSRFTLVGQRDTTELCCCAIEGGVSTGRLEPLPSPAEPAWPGLIRGLLQMSDRWVLVLEPAILLGVMEGWLESGRRK